MQTVRQSGYQVQRVRGQKRAETMVMECVICFAAMKKLKTGAPGGKLRQPFGMGVGILHQEGEGGSN
jgi:hypothetical protein